MFSFLSYKEKQIKNSIIINTIKQGKSQIYTVQKIAKIELIKYYII